MVRLTIGVPSLTKSTWENFGPIFPFLASWDAIEPELGKVQWQWQIHLENTFKEQSLRLLTFETFDQGDEKTWPDQQKDNDEDKHNDNDNGKDNDKYI